MKKDTIYLHESEVEWIEIARYNRKDNKKKTKKNNQAKGKKFVQK